MAKRKKNFNKRKKKLKKKKFKIFWFPVGLWEFQCRGQEKHTNLICLLQMTKAQKRVLATFGLLPMLNHGCVTMIPVTKWLHFQGTAGAAIYSLNNPQNPEIFHYSSSPNFNQVLCVQTSLRGLWPSAKDQTTYQLYTY